MSNVGMNSHFNSQNSKRYGLAQTLLLVAFAIVVFLGPKHALFVSTGAREAGNALCVAGFLLLAPALRALRGTIQIAPEPLPGKKLVESGIYRYFRHPIYSGILLCCLGLFLKSPTLWIGLAATAVIVFLIFKVRFEEKLLLLAYPDYAAYRNRSWGLFPGLRF